MSSTLAEIIMGAPDLDWLGQMACADDERDLADQVSDFFVEAGHTIDPHVLNRCRGCPVRVECLTWAYDQRIENGYYGGTSPGQRRKMTLAEALEYIADDPPQQIAS